MLDVGEAFGDEDAERLAPTGETVDLAETTIESGGQRYRDLARSSSSTTAATSSGGSRARACGPHSRTQETTGT